MKLIASLLTIATGIAAWMFLKKNKSALARLSLPKAKAPTAKASKASKTRKVKQKAHATPHKRNGMIAHAAH